ncbi:23S rRNA (cytidine(2498)-2'-O)-methyltransferase RlmM [Amphritea balenae]|uniref:Ribosomal RNA large subunit methyltransferase M n=1 Tax=Amphritea balenae TaxID=452629 RepID=A0A3P1SL21_9GAMM|nr:23S rRNA (cytidine(2498)-2'-O)-methyltransferase RlmM [Amphritea balenae]RRC97796.1 23S rRNA (cytidine(2498)-2'-O)-methyltransferase RlmM [Amphritea balenae]GGK83083.1 ribosomal RNA large subunit methyltransferase M [Amphritea balenae]
MNHLLLYCRPGFEKECAAEARELCEQNGIYGYCKLEENSGYALFVSHQPDGARLAVEQLDFDQLIFARQWVVCEALIKDIDTDDRIGSLTGTVEQLPVCCELVVEPADTTEGREMQRFCNSFGSAFSQSLRKKGLLDKRAPNRLHIFALSGSEFYVGYAPVDNSAPWPMGIMRLKFPNQAPSRSTLKLEEAWHWFIPQSQWHQYISSGKRAVDLGAAPGGWTWQLVNQNMFVTAIDNGPMAESLMESGQVKHLTEDAFTYEPQKRFDWMVCDIVDKPARVIILMTSWLVNGWCRETIFNLKLPMKQRYPEVRSCLNYLQEELDKVGLKASVAAKHLYHDREEITVHVRLLDYHG